MLRELSIENLAVIEKAEIDFSDNFNIFTGETGAGKSILINGINAVLGQRVTKDLVRNGCKKAVITGLFTDIGDAVKEKLDEMGLAYDNDEITITREIRSDGGSNARINFKAAPVSAIKELGELLVTIHGQHDNQILLSPEKHIDVLDSFGGCQPLIEDYKEDFKKLQSLAKKIGAIKKSRAESRERTAFLKERIDDLKEADLTEEEYLELEAEYERIKNIDSILKVLSEASALLNGEGNINDMLERCGQTLSSVSEYSDRINAAYERVSAAGIELNDLSDEIADIFDSFDTDPERIETINGKYSLLASLQKKYVCDYSGLLKLYEESRNELSEIGCSDEDLTALSSEKDKLLHIVTDKAKKLSQKRKKAADEFSKKVADELKFLDMPDVIIEVRQETGKLMINGMDKIEFLISANKGEEPKPIAKIASGGELSRIMLALKSVIADNDLVQTMIFDEIDTGVSGRAAQKIGIKLKQISKLRQVLCVSHLSQLAVMADNHMLIEKKTVGERTATNVCRLDKKGRIKEIARIMGGEDPSELIMKSAEEELEKAKFI